MMERIVAAIIYILDMAVSAAMRLEMVHVGIVSGAVMVCLAAEAAVFSDAPAARRLRRRVRSAARSILGGDRP